MNFEWICFVLLLISVLNNSYSSLIFWEIHLFAFLPSYMSGSTALSCLYAKYEARSSSQVSFVLVQGLEAGEVLSGSNKMSTLAN